MKSDKFLQNFHKQCSMYERIRVLDELLRMRRGAGLSEEYGEDGCNQDRGDKQGVALLKHVEREWSVICELLNELAKGGRRECTYHEDEEIDGSCRASAHALSIKFLDDNGRDRRRARSQPENVRR
jgi:hypothetical protein